MNTNAAALGRNTVDSTEPLVMLAVIKHTPTPWVEQDMPAGCNDRITADDGKGTTICEFPYGLDANAAFIVRACNAHHELVAALKDMRSRFAKCASATGSDDWAIVGACEKADAALAKAGAA
jgi:hypothetical protein